MPRHDHAARRRGGWRRARCDLDDAAGRRERRLTSPAPPGAIDEELTRIVARLPIGIVVVSKDALDVVYVNTAAERTVHPTRLRRGEALPDVWPMFPLRAYAKRLFGPSVVTDEVVQSGEDHSVLVRGVSARGANTAAILLDDVSPGQRRQRAEREFVANAAHELLTPLTGIIGAAHVLETGAKDVPGERERFIGHITRECARLARISRALLVLARAQSGEQPPRLEIVPLCELLEDNLAVAQEEAELRAIVDCARDITVFVDRDLFSQAFVNLLGNTTSHGSGDIVVQAFRLGPDRVSIDIVDDASRGADESAERLGRRFVTGSGRDSGGFGLGLSIARQSIEALGGKLTLASAGETFSARIEVLSGRAA